MRSRIIIKRYSVWIFQKFKVIYSACNKLLVLEMFFGTFSVLHSHLNYQNTPFKPKHSKWQCYIRKFYNWHTCRMYSSFCIIISNCSGNLWKTCLPATSPPFRSSVYLSVHRPPLWPAAGIPSGIAVGPDGEPFAENHWWDSPPTLTVFIPGRIS